MTEISMIRTDMHCKLICTANQWTGFYITGASVMKELMLLARLLANRGSVKKILESWLSFLFYYLLIVTSLESDFTIEMVILFFKFKFSLFFIIILLFNELVISKIWTCHSCFYNSYITIVCFINIFVENILLMMYTYSGRRWTVEFPQWQKLESFRLLE